MLACKTTKKLPWEGLGMNIREQIINMLLQQCDGLERMVQEYQKKIAELQKQLEEKKPSQS